MEGLSKESNQAVETEEHGCSAVNGQIRPLALGFDSQLRPAFLQGDPQTPALHKVSHDLLRCLSWVSRKEHLWGTLASRITRENPANGQRVRSRAIPQRGAATDLQRSYSLPIPVHGEFLPDGLLIL